MDASERRSRLLRIVKRAKERTEREGLDPFLGVPRDYVEDAIRSECGIDGRTVRQWYGVLLSEPGVREWFDIRSLLAAKEESLARAKEKYGSETESILARATKAETPPPEAPQP